MASQLRLRQLTSIDEIRGAAPAWDRLWERSDVSLPTVRAETAALWLEHFAPRSTVRVLIVQRDGEAVALLPLAGRRQRRLLPVADLPANVWASNGELLLDPSVDPEPVLDLLAGGLAELPWPLVWLDRVPVEADRWQAFLAAVVRRGMAVDVRVRYRIGQVELQDGFAPYVAGRSKNLRRQLRKDSQRLAAEGPVRLTTCWQLAPEEVEPRLRQAFLIERGSWKHEQGTAVLDAPGLFEFYLRQARQMAAWGCLRLAFLQHGGEPIAFELGWTAKGVYHSFKVGYRQQYGRYSPGHLLRRELIRALCEQPGHALVDFQGPMSDALAQWATRSYALGRLVVAAGGRGSRALLGACRVGAHLIRRLRGLGVGG